jgi:DNA topoisomerase IA
VNRAEKVDNFKPENYWVLSCELQANSDKVIKADSLRGPIHNEEEANIILDKVKVYTFFD